MRNLKKPGSLGESISKLLCLTLSMSLVLMGVPVKYSVAQPEGLRIEGTTPRFLREQERVLTEEQCIQLETRIKRLSDPRYGEGIRRDQDRMLRLADQAEADYEAAKAEARQVVDQYLKDLTELLAGSYSIRVWSSNKVVLRARVGNLRKKIPYEQVSTVDWHRLNQTVEGYLSAFDTLVGSVEPLTSVTFTVHDPEFEARVLKAQQASQSAKQSLAALAAEIAKTPVLNDLLDLAVTLTPTPIDDVTNILGKLGFGLAIAKSQQRISKRESEEHKSNIAKMNVELMSIEMDRNMYKNQYDRYCKVVARETEPPKASPEPPPPSIPESPQTLCPSRIVIGPIQFPQSTFKLAPETRLQLEIIGVYDKNGNPVEDWLRLANQLGGIRWKAYNPVGASVIKGEEVRVSQGGRASEITIGPDQGAARVEVYFGGCLVRGRQLVSGAGGAPVAEQPPPPPTPAPPAPTKAGGAGTVLLILGGAAAVAAAAVAAGGLSTDSGSSSSSSFACSQRTCVGTFSCSCSGSRNTNCTGSLPVVGNGSRCTSGEQRIAWCVPGLSCTNGRCGGSINGVVC